MRTWVLVLIGLAACRSSDRIDTMLPPPPPPVHLDPTLDSIQTKLLTTTCATRDCHSTGTHKADLILEAAVACANLVGVASTRSPTRIRLVPGQPDQSYLMNKLENRLDPSDVAADDGGTTGSLMPRSFAPTILPADERQAVRDWISGGAPGCPGSDAGEGDGGSGDGGDGG